MNMRTEVYYPNRANFILGEIFDRAGNVCLQSFRMEGGDVIWSLPRMPQFKLTHHESRTQYAKHLIQ